MKFTVWHAIKPNFGFGVSPEFNEQNYQRVAIVESPSVDEVFRITNHIDQSWTKNPEVIKFVGQPRSTSVGDVVVAETGTTYRCEMAGWSKI